MSYTLPSSSPPSSPFDGIEDDASEMEEMTPIRHPSSGVLDVPLLTRRQDEVKATTTPTGDVVFPHRVSGSQPLVTDALRMTYMVFFLLGVCMLFPWNALISAEDYFSVALRNSSFKSSFEVTSMHERTCRCESLQLEANETFFFCIDGCKAHSQKCQCLSKSFHRLKVAVFVLLLGLLFPSL